MTAFWPLTLVQSKLKNAKPHPRVQYEVGAPEQSSLPDDSYDLICVAQALHWFDHDAFWPEAIRVLKPNGIFAAWGYNWPVLEPSLERIFREEILAPIEPYWADQNKLLWNHYRELNIPFEKLDSPSFEMRVVWTLDDFFHLIGTFSAVRRCIDANGDEFFKRALDNAKQAWGDPSTPRSISFDTVLYVGRQKS